MTTQRMFKTAGMTRARALLRDIEAWQSDERKERRQMMQELEELERHAGQARLAVLAADPQMIVDNACASFNGIHATIEAETGDIMIHRPGVSWFLDDVALVSFVFGLGGAARDVTAAPVVESV